MTVRELLVQASARIGSTSETPILDAQVLLCHFLQVSRAYALAHPERVVDDASVLHDFDEAVTRRATGVPVAYLTGVQEFYGRPFHVTSDVLVPRPDTETLIDVARSYLRNHPATRIADIGTGSGNIGITLLLEHATLHADLVDISQNALDVARENATRHGVMERCAFWRMDGLGGAEPSGGLNPLGDPRIDLIVSNPPYLSPSWERHPSILHEPPIALYAENNGKAMIEQLIDGSKRIPLIVEFDPRQADEIQISARAHRKHAQLFPDLSGLPRVALITSREQAQE